MALNQESLLILARWAAEKAQDTHELDMLLIHHEPAAEKTPSEAVTYLVEASHQKDQDIRAAFRELCEDLQDTLNKLYQAATDPLARHQAEVEARVEDAEDNAKLRREQLQGLQRRMVDIGAVPVQLDEQLALLKRQRLDLRRQR